MGISNFTLPLEEKPIKILKIHWSSYFWVFLKILLLSFLIGGLVSLAVPSWWSHYYGKVSMFLFLGTVFVYLTGNYWKKFSTVYVITGDKLVDVTQEKILKRVVTEIEIENIEKIKIKRNLFRKKILDVGEIIFGLKDNKGILVFYSQKDPKSIKKTVKEIKEEKESILKRKGSECKVCGKESEEKVPLSFNYYGKKAPVGKKKEENLILVKKNITKEKPNP